MKKSYNILITVLILLSGMAVLVLVTSYINFYSWLIYAVPLLLAFVFLSRKKQYVFFNQNINCNKNYFIAALVMLPPFIFYFIKRSRLVNTFKTIADIFGIDVKAVGAIFASACAVASIFFLAYLLWFIFDYFGITKASFQKYRFLVKPAVILAIIFCVSLITIIRANFVYKDDMQRIVNGTTIYNREARYLAEFVMCLLEMDTYFVDISPIPQLLGMLVMAVFSVLCWHFLCEKKHAGFYDILAMSTFALTPYFLEGMSFKYDSPQHALAALFAILPLYFREKGKWQYIVATALSMIVLCSFHQAPMGLFPSLVIAKSFLDWYQEKKNNKEIINNLFVSAGAYLAGLIFYRIVLMKHLTRTSIDGVTNGITEIWPLNRIFSGVLENYKLFFGIVLNDFEIIWSVMIALLCVSFVVIFTFARKRGKIIYALASTGILILLLLLSFGLYPLLSSPLIDPRHLFSICFFVGIISVMAVCVIDKPLIIPKATTIVIFMLFFCFSIKYGNALSYQNDYTRFRSEMVASQLAEMEVIKDKSQVNLIITGDVGYSPEVKKMNSNMIEKLVPTMCSEYFGVWYAADLYNRYGLPIVYPFTEPYSKEDLTCVYDNYYYSIYQDDDKLLVDLKERNECLWVK